MRAQLNLQAHMSELKLVLLLVANYPTKSEVEDSLACAFAASERSTPWGRLTTFAIPALMSYRW